MVDLSKAREKWARRLESGETEIGYYFQHVDVRHSGTSSFRREYNLYYWPESREWTGWLMGPDGDYELSDRECQECARRFGYIKRQRRRR